MSDVIAFNDPYHDSSFCLLGASGPAHYEMERFTRRKLDRISPLLGALDVWGHRWHAALDGCRAIGVVEGDFLAPLFRRLMFVKARGRTDPRPFAGALLTALAADQTTVLPDAAVRQTVLPTLEPVRAGMESFVAQALRPGVIVTVLGHHHCHAANAFYASPYETACSVTLDGGGYDFLDGEDGPRREVYGSVWECAANAVTARGWTEDISIAGAWSRLTRQVFGLHFGEEGTVMAMAAYGDPARFAAAVAAPYIWYPNASLTASGYAAQIEALRQQMRTEQDRFDLAAALQQQTEFKVYAYLHAVVGRDVRHLCLSGGLFLNCQITGKVQGWLPWLDSVFVPPAPYDGGLSIGAAQLLYHEALGMPRLPGPAAFATGPTYDAADIVAACGTRGVTLVPATPDDIARRLDTGQIGAVFEGPAESGRRALGHRSILADPRRPESRTRINTDIKHRAAFRPFAPMVLADAASDWFVCPPGFTSPYMSFAVPVRGTRIPAVTHRDGTARVQTVHRDLTPGLHALLTVFAARTGVPVLLNTSFNDNEPIVQTPGEALECYLRTPLDFLYFSGPGLLARKIMQAS